jgi:hypothetical protein
MACGGQQGIVLKKDYKKEGGHRESILLPIVACLLARGLIKISISALCTLLIALKNVN